MEADSWNPRQYERFREERSRPFFDLLALVEARPGLRAVDLGCGTGELTRELHRTLACAQTLGVDSSLAMFARSAAFAAAGLSFEEGDLASFDRGGFDLVFSNAALQWLPDHPALLARLASLLTPGGQLAVQVPANHDHPSHLVAARVARETPFREALFGYERVPSVLAPEAYAQRLHSLGFEAQHVRLQVYGHLLESRDGVVEWVKGTLLTDYEQRLPPALWPSFLARYRAVLATELGDERPYFYPFKRILLWGRRPAA